MTLKEKFENNITGTQGNISIANDLAIGFGEWLFEHYNIISCYNKEELLKQYKKEKEL